MTLAALFYAKNPRQAEVPRRRRRRPSPRRRTLLFEPLESRLLLSAVPPLVPSDPLGSLVYTQSVSDTIGVTGQTDAFTQSVDPGHQQEVTAAF